MCVSPYLLHIKYPQRIVGGLRHSYKLEVGTEFWSGLVSGSGSGFELCLS